LQIGDVVRTTIDSIAFGGAGVGRVEGRVVFVPYTVTGDEVAIEIRELRKKFALGQVRKLLVPSEYRTESRCPYFGQCGGCQLQHVAYGYQLASKKRQVIDIFARLGKLSSPPVRDVIPSPRMFNYRLKADYHVQTTEGGVWNIGFRHATENRVLDIEGCALVEESINRSFRAWREALRRGDRSPASERQTIWATAADEKPPESCRAANGSSLITRVVQGRSLVFPREGFFQVNASLVDTLIEQVQEFAALTGGERVLDAYCGCGLFALFLAPRALSVAGIEISEAAVQCARSNLQKAGLVNTVFFTGNCDEILKQRFVKKRVPLDVVLLDPPRAGCHQDVLEAVRESKAKKVIYVSCNPATQARDIRHLVDRGFSLKCLQPLDMFPQTGHIEVIALLHGDGC